MTSIDVSGEKLARFTKPYRQHELMCSAHNFMCGLGFVILFALASNAPDLVHIGAALFA